MRARLLGQIRARRPAARAIVKQIRAAPPGRTRPGQAAGRAEAPTVGPRPKAGQDVNGQAGQGMNGQSGQGMNGQGGSTWWLTRDSAGLRPRRHRPGRDNTAGSRDDRRRPAGGRGRHKARARSPAGSPDAGTGAGMTDADAGMANTESRRRRRHKRRLARRRTRGSRQTRGSRRTRNRTNPREPLVAGPRNPSGPDGHRQERRPGPAKPRPGRHLPRLPPLRRSTGKPEEGQPGGSRLDQQASRRRFPEAGAVRGGQPLLADRASSSSRALLVEDEGVPRGEQRPGQRRHRDRVDQRRRSGRGQVDGPGPSPGKRNLDHLPPIQERSGWRRRPKLRRPRTCCPRSRAEAIACSTRPAAETITPTRRATLNRPSPATAHGSDTPAPAAGR